MMATIGRRSAVVQLPIGVRFTGTLAWLAWLGLHLIYLLGGRNRVTTLINLSWRYLAWGHGESVIVGDEPPEPLPGQKKIADPAVQQAALAQKATGKATANPE
jgi:NADH dehydrogenase